MKREFKQVSQSLGKNLSFGSFSGRQAIILGGVFTVTFFGTAILTQSAYTSTAVGAWFGLTSAFLSGKYPHKFWSKIYPSVPYWVRGQARYVSPVRKARIGSLKVEVTRIEKKRLSPFEDQLELATLGRIERDGFAIGCYILGKNGKNNDLSRLTIKFGFTCKGIHPQQRLDGQFEVINDALTTGFKEIFDSTFTFRWSSFCDYSDARAHLKERLENPVSPESEYLDNAQLARIQGLSNQRMRKTIDLNVYSTFTVRSDDGQKKDSLDRFIDTLSVFWKKKIEAYSDQIFKKKLISILNQALDAANRHLQILEEMGLRPTIQSEKELWNSLTYRVGALQVNLPHVLVLDDKGLREEFGSERVDKKKFTKVVKTIIGDEIHAASRLLRNGVPFADRRWVCVPDANKPGQKKYIGVMVLEEKPEGFLGDKGQIQNLWRLLSREKLYDIEVLTSVSPADQTLVRTAQQLLTRNAVSKDLQAQERRTIEVSAQINTERSVDAQMRLYTGDVPLNTSVVVLVYRDTPSEIDDVCRILSGLIRQPASLERETEYAWFIWIQTLGVRRDSILGNPYYRRLLFFASELSGVCNLLKVAAADKKGFELISDEGNSPVWIDFSKTKNLLVLGTTGSGKSLLIGAIIAECLALSMSVLIIDLPNDDGSGTFGDFTPFFGGFYFDISRERNNLVQPLDLGGITDPVERAERIKAHRNDVILIVTQLVLGSLKFDGFLVQTIESLIPLGIKAFYENPKIIARFEAARRDGLGSEAWANTPTLSDLETFYTQEFISLGSEDENVARALNFIRLQFQSLRASSIGEAIFGTSSFDTDGKLITFALTNLQSDKEAEIFGMSAYIAASRQSLSSPNSVFFMDEASVLLRFKSLSRLVGRKCATARKSGSRVFLAGQDAISIAKSDAGEQILQNMPCRLIGRIVPGAAASYHDTLGIPKEVITQNETFQPNIQQSYTQWLLDYNNNYVTCRYYPSYPILALTANSREEQAIRDRFKAEYPDKFDWLTEYYRYYKSCMKQGLGL
ncbi:MAG: DUF87 domain-containing protein [Nostocaceae cyanobacterium]|nr:DUF87 domain-containing protein [Nostocaceae cyanobacterium]